jgi:hypothetical protein
VNKTVKERNKFFIECIGKDNKGNYVNPILIHSRNIHIINTHIVDYKDDIIELMMKPSKDFEFDVYYEEGVFPGDGLITIDPCMGIYLHENDIILFITRNWRELDEFDKTINMYDNELFRLWIYENIGEELSMGYKLRHLYDTPISKNGFRKMVSSILKHNKKGEYIYKIDWMKYFPPDGVVPTIINKIYFQHHIYKNIKMEKTGFFIINEKYMLENINIRNIDLRENKIILEVEEINKIPNKFLILINNYYGSYCKVTCGFIRKSNHEIIFTPDTFHIIESNKIINNVIEKYIDNNKIKEFPEYLKRWIVENM